MASQHPSQLTIESMKNLLDESFTSLQKEYEDTVIKKFNELFRSVQPQISISEHSHHGVTNIETAIENQNNTPSARSKSSSPDYLPSKAEDEDKKRISEEHTEETTGQAAHNGSDKKENVTDEQSNSWLWGLIHNPSRKIWPLFSNTVDGKETSIAKDDYPEGCLSGKANQDITGEIEEKTDDQGVLSKTSTAKTAPYDVKAIEPVKDEKENITDVQNESSILNGIENSKDILLSKLKMFEHSIVSFKTSLQNCKVRLEERFKDFEEKNKDIINLAPPLTKINEPDHSDVQETNAQGESEPSSSARWFWARMRKYTVKTQLYCPKPSDLVTSVTEQLTAMLKQHTSTHNIELKTKMCKSAKDLKKDVPLILICLQSSRLGTDVSNAIKGIQTGPNVAVLILHHADIHALPFQSSRKILTAPEYKQIGTIVDIGFLSSKGLYECDMNQKSLADLALFIKRMSEKQQSI